MQLESDHAHAAYLKSKRKPQFDAQAETINFFQIALKLSRKGIDQDVQSLIVKAREISEGKVFSALDESPQDYLVVLLDQRRGRLGKYAQDMHNAVRYKEHRVACDLKNKSLAIQKNRKSIARIKEELENSLEVMRRKSAQMELPFDEDEARRADERKRIYQQFKQHGHWDADNPRNRSAEIFVQNMQRQSRALRQKHKQKLRASQERLKREEEERQREEEIKHARERQQMHNQYQIQKEKRQRQIQEEKRKQKQAQSLVKKYQQKVPAHIALNQKYKEKQEAEIERKKERYQAIRQERRHASLSQIRESMQEYEQHKQIQERSILRRQQMQNQEEEQHREELANLYRSQFYAKAEVQEKIVPPDEQKLKALKKMKMIQYSKQAQKLHIPRIDPTLRSQLQASIEQQKKRENKLQKITSSGEVILFRKEDLNSRIKGLEYLEEFKQMNTQLQRKPPPETPPEVIKLKDYSKKKKKLFKSHLTISHWKELLASESLSEEQKHVKMQQYFKLIDQEEVRALQAKRKASPALSIQIQRKLDHYEVQRAEAKLALLKCLK